MWEKAIAEYAKISLIDVFSLDIIDYLILKRDTYIYALSQTKEGIEALNEAWALEQTEPDYDSLINQFGV